MNEKLKGYLLAAVAAATYGMNPLFALPLYDHGMDASSVLFFRYLLAIPIVAAMIKLRGRDFKVSGRQLALLAGMGVLMVLSSIALFESYNFMGAGIASTILFVYPIIVALIMVLFYKEKLSVETALCILLAFCGILLLYKGEDGTTLSLTGTLLVLGSALSYALYIAFVSKTRLQRMPTIKITFYVLLFGFLLLFFRVDCGRSLHTPDQWYLWANLLALAVFPTVISFLCTTLAIQYIGSTPTAILGALEPVTAIFFGITIFGERLTLREGIGIVIIIVAVTLVIMDSLLHRYLTHFRKLFPKLPHKK